MKLMKTVSVGSMVAWMSCMLVAPCLATSVGISVIEQPVNLGTRSDPARIPLGGVGVISNYNYGIHHFIGEARACPDGAMLWKNGSELDQNLASVFGISVEAEDPTDVPARPVTLRVKSWKPPAYSPYTKEQVLAATLWCLIRSANGTPEKPLVVQVVAEASDDKTMEKKYSGKYVTERGTNGADVPPVNVPGTVLEEDPRGFAWVKFPDVTRKNSNPAPSPGMIILKEDGEGDAGWHLLPVWGKGEGENERLKMNNRFVTTCYSAWHSRGVTNTNSFLDEGGAMAFDAREDDKSYRVSIEYPHVAQTTLAADILALVISVQPTEVKPLAVSFVVEEPSLASFSAFHGAPGWKETRRNGNQIVSECEFTWDAKAGKLTKGSIPLVRLKSRGWITELDPDEDVK